MVQQLTFKLSNSIFEISSFLCNFCSIFLFLYFLLRITELSCIDVCANYWNVNFLLLFEIFLLLYVNIMKGKLVTIVIRCAPCHANELRNVLFHDRTSALTNLLNDRKTVVRRSVIAINIWLGKFAPCFHAYRISKKPFSCLATRAESEHRGETEKERERDRERGGAIHYPREVP